LRTFENSDGIGSLALIPDGSLAVGSRPSIQNLSDFRRIKIWNAISEELVRKFEGNNLVTRLRTLKNGDLISVSSYQTIIYNITTGKIKTFLMPDKLEANVGVLDIIQLKDGSLATGSLFYSINFWTIANDTAFQTHIKLNNSVRCLAELNNGSLLASGSDDNLISIWDLKS
jgi:WD40 repeat protein